MSVYQPLSVGDRVRIKNIPNLPRAGHSGVIERITTEDALVGGYTVRFSPGKGLGKCLIYRRSEIAKL
jgi:hypothetical protein